MTFVLRLRGEPLELPLRGESLDFIYRDTLPDLEEHADLGEISDPSPCFRRVGVVVSAIQGPRLHYIHIPESNLGQQFGELLEDVENADVTFDVSGEKFHAHRVVLAARSPVFKSMFFESSGEWNDKEISIEGTRPEVFKVSFHSSYDYGIVLSLYFNFGRLGICLELVIFFL